MDAPGAQDHRRWCRQRIAAPSLARSYYFPARIRLRAPRGRPPRAEIPGRRLRVKPDHGESEHFTERRRRRPLAGRAAARGWNGNCAETPEEPEPAAHPPVQSHPDEGTEGTQAEPSAAHERRSFFTWFGETPAAWVGAGIGVLGHQRRRRHPSLAHSAATATIRARTATSRTCCERVEHRRVESPDASGPALVRSSVQRRSRRARSRTVQLTPGCRYEVRERTKDTRRPRQDWPSQRVSADL